MELPPSQQPGSQQGSTSATPRGVHNLADTTAETFPPQDDGGAPAASGWWPIRIGYQVIFVVMLLFIVLGQSGGVVLYYRSQNSLDDQAEKLSRAKTSKTSDRVLEHINATKDIAYGMERYMRYGMGLHQKLGMSAEDDLFHAMSYGIPFLTRFEGPFLQSVEVMLLPDDETGGFPSHDLMYQKVWWSDLKTGERKYHFASYLPSMNKARPAAPDGTPQCHYAPQDRTVQAIATAITPVDSLKAKLSTTVPEFGVNVYDQLKQINDIKRRYLMKGAPNTTTESSLAHDEYLEPHVAFAEDGAPYLAFTYRALFNRMPDNHSWGPHWGFSIALSFKIGNWEEVAREVVGSDFGGRVVVYDLAMGIVYAAAQHEDDPDSGATDTLSGCRLEDGNTTSPLSATMSSRCVVHPIRHSPAVRDAFHDHHRSDTQPSSFDVMLLGDDAYFTQFESIFRQVPEADALSNIADIHVAAAVLYSTSETGTNVHSAQIVLLVFFVAVILIYLVLCLVQYFLVNLPLEQLVTASNLMASLKVEQASQTVASDPSCLRIIQLQEVQILRENFQRTLQFMAEYVKYVPSGVLKGLEMNAGGMGDGIYTCDQSQSETAVHVGSPAHPPRQETTPKHGVAANDARLLASLRSGFSMKTRSGSILQLELKCLSWLQAGSCLQQGGRSISGENGETSTGPLISGDTVNELAKQFVGMSLSVCKKTGGVMLLITPDVCIITWNFHNNCHGRYAPSACHAACEIKKRMQQLDFRSPTSAPGQLPLVCAIASGSVLAGSVGDSTTRAIAAVGEAVTLVGQLTSLCYQLGVAIGISEETFDRVSGLGRFDIRAVDRVRPEVGRARKENGRVIVLYEFRGELKSGTNGADSEALTNRARYGEAWQSFCSCDFETACRTFESITKKDRQVRRLLQLARYWVDFPDRRDEEFARSDFYVRSARFPYDHFEAPLPTFVPDATDGHSGPETRPDTESGYGAADVTALLTKDRHGLSASLLNGTHIEDPQTPHSGDAVDGDYFGEGDQNPLPPVIRMRTEMWYTSHKVLGKGSFGTMYAGMTPEGELVAMKVLTVDTEGTTEEEQMEFLNESNILQEIQYLKILRHENIVGYHGTVFEPPHIIIVMEYMPGGSLAHLLDVFKRITESTVIRYAKDMLKGLRFLAENEIVHGDFKPGNVLVMSDGTCKLSDFGFGGSLNDFKLHDPDGLIVGTALYMAPEVARGERRELKSDIWAFGITIAELLEGDVPYVFDRDELALQDFFQGVGDGSIEPRSIIATSRGLSKSAKDFLAESLHHDHAARASAAQLSTHGYLGQHA
eukprot:TRINITY_DN22114_c0_g1_i1.p1 TRINITY_DN22114_c0_g1~~TRINITY_DN22114_c0_g1_i1.p1  ORF type:complete len:1310 (+),score=413.42 TRINITY_DN22114_c0_g1_i1:101-4030(+)